jgi:cytochrome bd ubiquinol oxidase subunit I
MAATPLGFIAVLAGWCVTEAGRQPYVVYGHLRTIDAVAPVTSQAVALTLLLFFIVYNVLLLAFLWFGARTVLKGPAPSETTGQDVRPGLDRAGPAIAGAPAVETFVDGVPAPGV